jgi:cell division protein ZapD
MHVTFEHPLNERVRTFLRLEHLFGKVAHFLPQADPWAMRVVVESLLDVVSITSRADIRGELLKELDRNAATLAQFARQPGVDPQALGRVQSDLAKVQSGLMHLSGPIGQLAREDEFLKSIAQRNSIPGGTCSFDLPSFHFWLMLPPERRDERFSRWMQDLDPVNEAIALVLMLARGSARPRRVVAEAGFFQEALDIQAPAQLVRVSLNGGQALFPEISGHKSRFSIRFLSPDVSGRPAQSRDDVDFTLACCAF